MNHKLTLWERHGITWITAHMIDQANDLDLSDDHVVVLLRAQGYSNREIAEIGEGMEHWCIRRWVPRDLTKPEVFALKILIENSPIASRGPENPFRQQDTDDARMGLRFLALKLEQRGFEVSHISA